ncbi:MAG: hypothetical protein ACOVOT_06225 [Rubrivivax sp.]
MSSGQGTGKSRTMEDHFTAVIGTDITDAFRRRAHPVARVLRP